MAMAGGEEERLRRWRLVLGQEADAFCTALGGEDLQIDQVLRAVYESDRTGGLGSSSPNVNRWLGDIRRYFSKTVVRVMQKDALERLGLSQLLTEPELLESVEPDVHLVASLLSLRGVIPERTKETARQVVRKVVDEVEGRLANPLVQAVRGSLHKATRSRRPRPQDIDWDRTIRKNLSRYVPERRTVIAEQLVGWARRRSSLQDVVLCVDQSGSMATSVVYAGIFGAVLATVRAVSTRVVMFDTAVADLSEELHDPVDLLFGAQLGGGTDINRALAYCQELISRPAQTLLFLITDLFEGGNAEEMVARAAEIVGSGVQMVCLLALNDDGPPCFDEGNAARLAGLGVPAFACTPDQFPELVAAAIRRADLVLWAARNGVVTKAGS